MLSVLLFQIFRIRDHESDFERLLHGARNIVSGAKRNLDAIANSIDTDTLPPGEKYYLTDASYWLDDLQAQIDRNERTREPKQIPVAPINLYGQVLSKFAPLAKRRAAWEQAAFDGLVGADKMSEEYRTWPPVLGDVTAIETVFRNLLDNSVKYRRSETLDIAMEVQVDEGAGILRVHYEDGGIGVPDGDRGVAFEDGFRGAAALARAPVGLGSGLAESLQLLNAIGGQIYLSDRQSRFGQGSVFVVEMRIAKRQRRYR
jgi:signal transduction histidine kinase